MPAGDAAGGDAAEPTDLSGPEVTIFGGEAGVVYDGPVSVQSVEDFGRGGRLTVRVFDAQRNLLVILRIPGKLRLNGPQVVTRYPIDGMREGS